MEYFDHKVVDHFSYQLASAVAQLSIPRGLITIRLPDELGSEALLIVTRPRNAGADFDSKTEAAIAGGVARRGLVVCGHVVTSMRVKIPAVVPKEIDRKLLIRLGQLGAGASAEVR